MGLSITTEWGENSMRSSVSAFAALLFFTCTVNIGLAAEIKIGAGGAFIDAILNPIKANYEKASGNKLIITERGFKHSMQALENGEIDLVGAGVSPSEFEGTLISSGVTVKDPKVFNVELIADDKIIVAVNKSNNIKSLNKEQLKGIFTGKITNWKDVGGAAEDIVVVWVQFLVGPNQLFSKKFLDDAPATKDVLSVNTLVDGKAAVISTPQAIMIYPSAKKDSSLSYPETPLLTRSSIVVTKGQPSPDTASLIKSIKSELAKK
jgi:phosphate transport system substrate-binding protein